jgi:HK97 gp10 family phage protein
MSTGYTLRILFDHLPQIIAGLDGAVGGAVEKGAEIAKENIQAITPVDTGRHKNSITTRKTGPTKAQVESDPDLDYPWFLEHGTYKMAARPHFTPGGDRSQSAIYDVLARALMDLAR